MILLFIYLAGATATTIQIVREDSKEPEWIRIAVAAIVIVAWPVAWLIVIIHQIRMRNLR